MLCNKLAVMQQMYCSVLVTVTLKATSSCRGRFESGRIVQVTCPNFRRAVPGMRFVIVLGFARFVLEHLL